MESLFYVPLLGSIRLFVSAPTPVFLVLAIFSTVVSSIPLIPLSSTRTAFLSISSLEMLAVIVSFKLWSVELRGQRILVRTDNQNTELAINTGRSRVPFVQSCLHELWFYASLFDFEIRALYIPDHQNTIADSLSRWDTDPQLNTSSTRPPTFITAP